MKLCFYSPYLPHSFGGGEKHLLDVAVVAARNHQVFIAISGTHSPEKLAAYKTQYEAFYGSSLEQLTFISSPLGGKRALEKLWWTKKFDGLYYVTDGSLFFSLARYNFLHIQIPFTHKLSKTAQIKLLNWTHINTNSEFTKEVIEQNWHCNVTEVIHPSVDSADLATTQDKEKIILSVGRFFRQLHSKRQDILVEIFTQLLEKYPQELRGWKLVLIGSIEDQTYFDAIKTASAGKPITILANLSREELIAYYKKAALYWHAAGFEVDATIHPESVEHFGITTLEAMAAGAVPLVVAQGGQKEVLGDLQAELGWDTTESCVEKTIHSIRNPEIMKKLRIAVAEQAQQFDQAQFSKQVERLFSL